MRQVKYVRIVDNIPYIRKNSVYTIIFPSILIVYLFLPNVHFLHFLRHDMTWIPENFVLTYSFCAESNGMSLIPRRFVVHAIGYFYLKSRGETWLLFLKVKWLTFGQFSRDWYQTCQCVCEYNGNVILGNFTSSHCFWTLATTLNPHPAHFYCGKSILPNPKNPVSI